VASRQQARKNQDDNVTIEEELEALEQLLERCKVLYEQHFMGIQKLAPDNLHRQLERRLLKLTQTRIRNTATRFRFTTLSQKFGAYNTYWRRTMRAIEQGRYVRHVAQAARRSVSDGKDVPDEILMNLPQRLRERILRERGRVEKRAGREGKIGGDAPAGQVRQPRPQRYELDEADGSGDVDFDAMFDAIKAADDSPPVSQRAPRTPNSAGTGAGASSAAPRPATPAVPASRPGPARPPPLPSSARPGSAPPKVQAGPGGRPRPAPAAPTPPGMNQRQVQDLYQKYVQAKKSVGEPTDAKTYDRLLRTLHAQAPKIMKQHRASEVEFQVAVKDNAVVLQAKPKKTQPKKTQ
jgi:hypothetical protein